jgi:hypothetical protein
MGRIFLACILSLFAATRLQPAQALEVSVAGTPINVAAPDGYCALESKHPMDSQVIAATQQAIQSVNEELALFVACDRLTAWRDGKTDDLGDTADYQVQSKLKTQNFSPEKILPVTCTLLRKQGGDILNGKQEQIAKDFNSIKALAGQVKLNEQQVYGVLHEDKTGCYAGIVQKFEVSGKAETVFVVMAITVVKGKVLYLYHGSGLSDPETITRLLNTSRTTIPRPWRKIDVCQAGGQGGGSKTEGIRSVVRSTMKPARERPSMPLESIREPKTRRRPNIGVTRDCWPTHCVGWCY